MGATHVGLLRGVNIGKAKRVSMAELRALVEAAGYGEPRTLLNSGNVAFSAPGADSREVAAILERGLLERVGVSARVLVLTAGELRAIVAANPLAEFAHDDARMFVTVLAEEVDPRALHPLLATDWGEERMAAGPRCIYAWCPHGFSRSPLVEGLNRVLKDRMTSRNWATMVKLARLVED